MESPESNPENIDPTFAETEEELAELNRAIEAARFGGGIEPPTNNVRDEEKENRDIEKIAQATRDLGV